MTETDATPKINGGYFRVPNVVMTLNLSPNDIALYCAIAMHANNKTGKAHPSQARLASIVGVSRNTIKRGIERLCKAGLITVDENGTGGRGRVSEYRLLDASKGTPLEARKKRTHTKKGSTSEHVTDPEKGQPVSNKGSTSEHKGVNSHDIELDDNYTGEQDESNKTPKPPLTGPTPEEQKRILHKITQLALAKQDAKTDAERDELQAQFDQYRAELAAAEQREATAAGLD